MSRSERGPGRSGLIGAGLRGTLAAAAFAVAVALLPNVSWTGRTTTWMFLATLVVVGALNAALPIVPVRRWRPAPGWAVGAAAIALNAGLVVALSLVERRLRVGVQMTDLSIHPVDALLAAILIGFIAALPIMVERALGAMTADRSLASIRPRFDGGLPILLIFLLSGASGLIYEVVWSRQLVLVFGNTTQAVSAILTGYFGGLAIGSVIGGRLVDRAVRPLRIYAFLELALVVVVLATPSLFRGLDDVYRSGYGALETQPTTLALIRYVLALLALAPATILMGATLPTLSRYLSASAAELGGSFGRLYAVNTVGAVAGTIVAGLVLIELVGLGGTLLIGAAGSATAGVAAFVMDRRRQRRPEAAAMSPGDRIPEPPTQVPPEVRRFALIVAFVSGLTSLGYQVLWTRLLSSGSGNSTYVFTLILATFLVGLAVGAAYVARRPIPPREAMAWLGGAQIAVAAIVLAGVPIVGAVVGVTWPLLLRVLLVVLPSTLLMGVTLPMASNLIGIGGHRIGRDAGLLLGANTLGAICGTFVIPFVAIPIIGSPRSLVTLCVINAALGVGLVLRSGHAPALPRRPLLRVGSLAAVVAAIGLVVPNGLVSDPGTARFSGTGLYATREDEIASVQAGATGGRKRLLVGGTGMTALTVDAKLMALMPEFIRPSAQRMLVICFGMGSSFRTGLRSGLSVDGVELVPSVPQMFGYFQPDAAAVLANPKGRIVIADGRNYVELTDQRYDIVVVDPPPPIESSGTAVLYSEEFYEAAGARLTDGGVMMEWMPAGQSVDEFRAHVRTFAAVFPNVLLAFGPATGGVFMLGSRGPTTLDPDAIASVLSRPGVVGDLVEARDAPAKTLEAWEPLIPTLKWIAGGDVTRFAGTGPLITDDHPLTEYFLLRRAFGQPSPRASPTNLRAALGH